MYKAVLFESANTERFENFKETLARYEISFDVLSFGDSRWINYDYSQVDFVIYFPTFEFTSNHPLALVNAKDNIEHLHRQNPHLIIFPEPKIVGFYNDKYRQHLFLSTGDYPYPKTVPLLSEASLKEAEETLGFPLVVKNRYGAGGDQVFQAESAARLRELFDLSRLDFMHSGGLKFLAKTLGDRDFYWHTIKNRKSAYPLLSTPLLAQEFLNIDCDLKTVTGYGEVIEAHWRFPVDEKMWKMNIDGGGVGVWSKVPDEALDISERMCKQLDASWLNIDLLHVGDRFYVSEFSPVWHHYKYKEKPTFRYEDDYNIDTSLEIALDLERIIVESMLKAAEAKRIP